MDFQYHLQRQLSRYFEWDFVLACEYSCLSSLPAPEGRFARETSAIPSQKFHTDDVNLMLVISYNYNDEQATLHKLSHEFKMAD